MTPKSKPVMLCARCDATLSLVNTNPDHLCGLCQRDISASRSAHSLKYRAWVAGGRLRLFHRTASGRLKALVADCHEEKPLYLGPVLEAVVLNSRAISCPELANTHMEDLLRHMGELKARLSEVNLELIKRKRELEVLVATLDGEIHRVLP